MKTYLKNLHILFLVGLLVIGAPLTILATSLDGSNKVQKSTENIIKQEGEEKPATVPDNYVKVIFDPTDKAIDSKERIYYVNPQVEVSIAWVANGTEGNNFLKWVIQKDATTDKDKGVGYYPGKKYQMKDQVSLRAVFVKDVVEQVPNKGKPDVPSYYRRVTIDSTNKAARNQNTYFWVHPNKKVLIPIKNPKPKFSYYRFRCWRTVKNYIYNPINLEQRHQFFDDTLIKAWFVGTAIKQEGNKRPPSVPDNYKKVIFDPTDKALDPKKHIYWVVPEDEKVMISVDHPIGRKMVKDNQDLLDTWTFDRWERIEGKISLFNTQTRPNGDIFSNMILNTKNIKDGEEFKALYTCPSISHGKAPKVESQVIDRYKGQENLTVDDYLKALKLLEEKDGQKTYLNYEDFVENTELIQGIDQNQVGLQEASLRLTYKNKATRLVKVKVQVYELVYKGLANGEKPQGVPGKGHSLGDYIKITVDPTDQGESQEKTFYYVNPNLAVTLPLESPKGRDYFRFKEWMVEEKKKTESFDPKAPRQFTKATTIKASYTKGPEVLVYEKKEPANRPVGYMEVKFDAEEGLRLKSPKIYYLRKDTKKTLADLKGTKSYGYPDIDEEVGYEFIGWDLEDDREINGDFLVKAKAKKLDPVLSIEERKTKPRGYVKVTFNGTHKGSLETKGVYYINPNKALILKPPKVLPNIGFEFIGWDQDLSQAKTYGEGELITAQYNTIEDVVTEEKPGYVEVSFMAGDHGRLQEGNKTYYVNPKKGITLGKDILVPTPQGKENYIFDHWSPKLDMTQAIQLPVTYLAIFKLKTVNLSYQDLKDDAFKAKDYPIGTKLTLPQPPKTTQDHYTFRAWFVHGQEYKPGQVIGLEKDTIIKALWTLKTYQVTFDTQGGGDIAPRRVKVGQQLGDLKAPSKKGYLFLGWTLNGRDFDPSKEPINQDITLIANYKENKNTNPQPIPQEEARPKNTSQGQKAKDFPQAINFHWNLLEQGSTPKKEEKPKAVRYEKAYIQGFKGAFRPKAAMTRAEGAQILANILRQRGRNIDLSYQVNFKDIGEDKWYVDALTLTSQAGLFIGDEEGNFNPDRPLSRAEWITLLRRLQGLNLIKGNTMGLKTYHWALEEVQTALEKGWLAIYTKNLVPFDPDGPIYREEVVALTNKALNRSMDRSYIKNHGKDLITFKDIDPSMWAYEDILCAANSFLTKSPTDQAHKNKDSLLNSPLQGN